MSRWSIPQDKLQILWQVLEKIGWWAFLLFMACLPLTNFPFFPPVIGGGALVRPLSVYPLFILIPLVVLPRLLRARLPRSLIALGIFVMMVIVSGLFSMMREVTPIMDVSGGQRVLRVLITLGLGCAFYLTVALVPRNYNELKAGLKAMYAGFSLALFWACFQVVYILNFQRFYFKIINHLQGYITTRRLFENRVSGMTYEPSWFAEQITILLLPWLLASVITGRSVFRLRWRWVTVELFLLVWSTVILVFTFSRAGILDLATLAVLSLVLFYLQRKSSAVSSEPQSSMKPGAKRRNPRLQTAWKIIRVVLAVTLVFTIIISGIYLAGQKYDFFMRLWDYWETPHPTFMGYLQYLGFEARMIYGETAYNMYLTAPVIGVGPGVYALYFADSLPYHPLAKTPEVIRLITPEEGFNRLITAKNFFLRLLAETGIVGTAAFIAFFISIVGMAINLWLSPEPEEKYWGVGAVMALAVFVLSTLSFDSFALPNMWVIFGLITAAFSLRIKTTWSDSANKQLLQPSQSPPDNDTAIPAITGANDEL
jgi:hypothetical protein